MTLDELDSLTIDLLTRQDVREAEQKAEAVAATVEAQREVTEEEQAGVQEGFPTDDG